MEFPFIVGGKKRISEKFKEIKSPWDGEVCSKVFLAQKEDIEDGVSLADRSFERTKSLM